MVQETRTLPAPFIEAAGVALTDKITPLLGTPVDTSAFAPQVAAQDPLQLQPQWPQQHVSYG